MGMTKSQLDRLDEMAQAIKDGGSTDRVGVLSTGERLYVALAANSSEILKDSDDTIVEAIHRVGVEDMAAMVERWKFRH